MITRLQIIAAMTAAIAIGTSIGLGIGFAFTHWFG